MMLDIKLGPTIIVHVAYHSDPHHHLYHSYVIINATIIITIIIIIIVIACSGNSLANGAGGRGSTIRGEHHLV